MRCLVVVIGSLLLAACDASAGAPASLEAPLAQAAPPPSREVVSPGDVVLDVRQDGARLVGHVLLPPPGTDADRLVEAWLEVDGRPVPLPFLRRVIDARFAEPGRIVFVDAAHVLWSVGGGDPIVVDEHVEAPLAVRGHDVVYARGEMPFFELARVHLDDRAITTLTQGYAPAYSPAIDEDESVVFVSSREGRPRLYRVYADGRAMALPATDRTPSSPHAPSIDHGRLTFEDERGTLTIDLASGQPVAGAAR